MCWNLKEKRRIWMYEEEPRRSVVCKFAAEVVDEGRVAMIVLGLHVTITEGLESSKVCYFLFSSYFPHH
jgi:hypothetical protein